MSDSTSNDITNEILENAVAPRRAQGDTGSMEQHSIPDQIAADRYAKSQQAAKVGLGFRRVQLRPGGNHDLDISGGNY